MKLTKPTKKILVSLLIAVLGSLAVAVRPYVPLELRNGSFPFSRTSVSTLQQNNKSLTVGVARVIDGDTIVLETGEHLRYIGVDTPETKHPTKSIQCFGKEAYEENKRLVEGKKVRLEKDVSNVDKYNRLLRYVYVPTVASPSGIMVNDYLVSNGFAYSTTFPPDVKYEELFRSHAVEARKQLKGLWRNCPVK